MKLMKKTGTYKASNVEFNPDTMIATSYDWWQFVRMINGKIVFNNYSYSNTTCRHQSKVRGLLRELNINIDLEVTTNLSLNGNSRYNYGNELDSLKDAVKTDLNAIKELEETLLNTRRKKALDESRQAQIVALKEHIEQINRVMFPFPLDRALNEVI